MPTLHQRLGPLRQAARGIERALWAQDALDVFERARTKILTQSAAIDAFGMEALLLEYFDAAFLLARCLYGLRLVRPDLKLPQACKTNDRKTAILAAERFYKYRFGGLFDSPSDDQEEFPDWFMIDTDELDSP